VCASAFLPLFIATLFWKRANKVGAIVGMLSGLAAWAVWTLLFHEKESAALGICSALFGKPSLVTGTILAVIDPIVIALPLSAIVLVTATVATNRSREREPGLAPSRSRG
jgi:solute:Na+ symporter, SSS family